MTTLLRPLVSVVIPAWNAAAHIEHCLSAVLGQDYPLDRMEIIVVDGASDDDTADRARGALADAGLASARVVHNPGATTPSNLNAGLAEATGDYVARVDARSALPADYISRCVAVLEADAEVVVVGGRPVAVAPGAGLVHRGIARSWNQPLPGLSSHRRSSASGPADTVYLGFFRRHELIDAGGWDERFDRNQDFELNRRLGRTGIVWFDAGISVEWVPVPTLGRLWRQNVTFGRWKVRYWRLTGDRPRPRQWVLLAIPPIGAVLAAVALLRSPRLVGGAAVVGSATLVVPSDPRDWATIPERIVAASSTVLTGVAWTLGVWSELLRPRTRS